MDATSACRKLLPGLALLVLSLPAAAQVNSTPGEWHRLGPEGGIVTELIAAPSNPQVVYLIAQGALYRSGDGGASWIVVSDEAEPVFKLAIDAVNPSLLYADQSLHLVKSLNGGTTWAIVDVPGELNEWVGHPKFAKMIFAATDEGLFRSANAGFSWKAFRRGFPAEYRATRIVIDPVAPRRMYVAIEDLGTRTKHIFKSLDGGTSWQPIDNGPLAGKELLELATHPRSSQILYASIPEGVYKSTDGGKSWMHVGLGAAGFIHALEVHPAMPNVVYAGSDNGLYRSRNAGATWVRMSKGLPESDSVYELLVSRQTILASVFSGANPSGVFRSSDGGTSWTFSSKGIFGLTVSAIDFGAPGTLWIVADGFLFRSTDRGLTWSRIQPDPATTDSFTTVAVDPTDRSKVFVMSGFGTVWRSDDGGNTWEAAGSSGLQSLDFVVDPQTPSTLYAAGASGITKSTDRGTTWIPLPAENVRFYFDIDVAPSSPSTLYAAGTFEDLRPVFLRSTDGGASWTRLNFVGRGDIYPSLAIDPLVATTVYTADEGFIHKSTDGGQTWSRISNPVDSMSIYPLEMSASGRLYTGVWNIGVVSFDEGDPTGDVLGGRFFNWGFMALAADPHDPCSVYMGAQVRSLLVFVHSGTAECPGGP